MGASPPNSPGKRNDVTIMIRLGTTKNMARNSSGGPATRNFVMRRLPVPSVEYCAACPAACPFGRLLVIKEDTGIMAPGNADRITHFKECCSPRRGVGQQSLDIRAVSEFHD